MKCQDKIHNYIMLEEENENHLLSSMKNMVH